MREVPRTRWLRHQERAASRRSPRSFAVQRTFAQDDNCTTTECENSTLIRLIRRYNGRPYPWR